MKFVRFRWILASLVLVMLTCGAKVRAQTITQSYEADKTLQRGMLVALNKANPKKVEAISTDRASELFGVVVGSNDSTIVISEAKQPVLVATSGRYQILVSTQNGSIKVGDDISVSSVAGIGMKTDNKQPTTIGKALEAFSGSTSKGYVTTATYKDGSNKDQKISIGRIYIDLSVAKKVAVASTSSDPIFLQRIAETVAGKQVATARLYASMVLLLAVLAVSGSIIYGAVRSGIISIGRNPLSKHLIIGSILQMVLVSFIVFFVGLIGVYLLLKL